MKTILLLLAALCLSAPARDVIFAWDANPLEEAISGYRLERQDGLAWVEAGKVTDQGTGTPTEVRITDFPDALTVVRLIAISEWGESDPSNPLTIGATPGQPQGLRFSLSPKVASVEAAQPGRWITIEQSTDLMAWREIARGWGYVVASLPILPRAFFRTITLT